MNYISKIAIKGGEEYPIRDSVSTDSFVDVVFYQDTTLTINGEERAFVRGKKYRIYDIPENFSFKDWSTSYMDCTHLDTSKWTSMREMFRFNPSVTCKIDGLDTSNVTDLAFFCNARYFLNEIEVGGFDTRNVTNMAYALNDLARVRYLNVGGWDTSKVTNMVGLFAGLGWNTNAHIYLDLRNWDLSSCTNIGYMFYECNQVQEIMFGEGFGKCAATKPVLDLTHCELYTFSVSTLCDMYDRAANGMPTMTIKLHANTKAVLTEEQINTLTSKGYTVL